MLAMQNFEALSALRQQLARLFCSPLHAADLVSVGEREHSSLFRLRWRAGSGAHVLEQLEPDSLLDVGGEHPAGLLSEQAARTVDQIVI